MNFFNEPYDLQVTLGLTLVGVPNSWDEMTLVGFIKSYSYAFGPNEVCIVSTFLENPTEEVRKAHITCNNLYSKQKLLKIRLIPVIVGEDNKSCQIITVRPYCFWIKLDPDSVPIPYMLPKYGSQDITYESVEAKMLLHENNIHPSIVTCLMELNLIPKDGSYWCGSDAIAIWLSVKEQNQNLFNFLETLLGKVQETASIFVPYPYQLKDESVYSSNWNQLLTPDKSSPGEKYLWPWELIGIDSPLASDQNFTDKKRKGGRKIGCIRYESNRKRWVVDLSLDGKRLQKCFHETYYGLSGGLSEALKWRFEFLKDSKAPLSLQSELKTISDIFEKIMQIKIDDYKKQDLIQVLKKPIEGFDQICQHDQLVQFIDTKLKTMNRDGKDKDKDAENNYDSDSSENLDAARDEADDSYKKFYRTKRKTWNGLVA